MTQSSDSTNLSSDLIESNKVSSLVNEKKIFELQKQWILVTGGTGYIGSHTIIELINSGFTNIVVIDNLINSSRECLNRVEKITNCQVKFYKIDIAKEYDELKSVCSKYNFFACFHFAGLKAVGESVSKPLLYYQNNLQMTMNLIECLNEHNCYNIIFSSSATVYGTSAQSPISEQCIAGVGLTNPYGKTKYFIEEMLIDYAKANSKWNVIILRYFNPIGAHESGLIGEDPSGIPNNLMPYVLQVAVGRRPYLSIYGNDYNTIDGTGVRDYIHVCDLAKGHVAALNYDIIPKAIKKLNNNEFKEVENSKKESLSTQSNPNNISNDDNKNSEEERYSIYNLGTGKGTSVLELVAALTKVCKHEIPTKIVGRRPGDIDTVFADCALAQKKLNWKAEYSVEKACEDSWRWQSNNPNGFSK